MDKVKGIRRSPLLYGVIISFAVSVTSLALLINLDTQIKHRINAYETQNKVSSLDRALEEWMVYNLLNELQHVPEDSLEAKILSDKIHTLVGKLEDSLRNDSLLFRSSNDLKEAWLLFNSNFHDETNRKKLKALVTHLDDFEQNRINNYSPNIDSRIKIIISASFALLLVSGILVFQSLRIQDKERQQQLEVIERLEEAKRLSESSNQLKSKFVATVSHEIRTPINGIVGAAEMINHSDLNSKDRRLVRLIYNSSQTLLNLVNGLLDFSRLESNDIKLNPIQISLKDLINQVIESMSWKAESKSLNLSADIHKNVPDFVEVDVVVLKQILINLIGNGLKFTHHGSVTLKVRTVEDSQKIFFSVEDTGLGIPEDSLPKLFTPFYQAHNIGTTEESGTGLGLAISQRLVEKMGGKIQVESRVDYGTRFYFSLPLKIIPAEDFHITKKSEEISEIALDGIQVLIVEDNFTNQIVCEEMIREYGGTSISAVNGLDAINKVYNHPDINIILMDCQMPDMDGYETTTILRDKGITLPILALTANAGEENKKLCINAGMDGFIVKPISQRDLIRKIKEFTSVSISKSNVKPLSPTQQKSQIQPDLSNHSIFNSELSPLAKEKVINSYLSTLSDLEDQLQENIENLELFNKLGHKFKSSSLVVGEDEFSKLCKKLEDSEKIDEAQHWAQIVLERLPEVSHRLQEKLHQMS